MDDMYFVVPPGTAQAGYDADPKKPGSIWRMQVTKGNSKEVGLVGPWDKLDNLVVSSNTPAVVKNGDIKTRISNTKRFGETKHPTMMIITLTGSVHGTTMLQVRLKSPNPPSLADVSLKADSKVPSARTGIAAAADALARAANTQMVTLQVQVTRKDGTLPRDYSGIGPEGQFDASACWAACFAWWLKAAPGRKPMGQKEILGRASSIWNSSGAMDVSTIKTFYESQHAKMTCDLVAPPDFDQYVVEENLPLIIALKNDTTGGHVNVIHAIDPITNDVKAMDPWFPEPIIGDEWELTKVQGSPVIHNKKDGSAWKFTGKHVKWPMSYYKMRPYNGKFLICHPS
jgi:hypothetical protein